MYVETRSRSKVVEEGDFMFVCQWELYKIAVPR